MTHPGHLADYDGYIFDLDGTIYLGERLLPGAGDTIEALRAQDKKVVFLSNKPIQTRTDYAHKLTRLGVETGIEDVINSSYVMARYLRSTAPGATVYVIGEPPLINELAAAGLDVPTDPSDRYDEVAYVVAAFDRTFHYAKLNHALQAIKAGARFVATNGDRTCPVENGEIPDAGGVIGAIEGTSGKQVDLIVGKPNRLTIEAALERLQLGIEDCLMVGDRIETDILMGNQTGMDSALVLTGVTRRDQLPHPDITPTYILEGVSAIGQALKEERSR